MKVPHQQTKTLNAVSIFSGTKLPMESGRPTTPKSSPELPTPRIPVSYGTRLPSPDSMPTPVPKESQLRFTGPLMASMDSGLPEMPFPHPHRFQWPNSHPQPPDDSPSPCHTVDGVDLFFYNPAATLLSHWPIIHVSCITIMFN